jgi:L-threonylcarbamoyladenylate synthase
VALPTETVYGLGADATNAAAVARIYEAKGRPADHPLIVHLSEMADISEWADEIPEYAIALARKYWPGPMTLIFTRSSLAQNFITGGQASVGLRVPDHVVALALLAEFKKLGGQGIAAPSANRFGHVSPTSAASVNAELADYLVEGDLILDGGQCSVGLESTIIDCTGPAPIILRQGAITKEMINNSINIDRVKSDNKSDIRVSGSLESHYSPNAHVVLDTQPQIGEGFIAMDSIETPPGAIRLSAPSSIEGFAREIYSALRFADAQGLTKVCVIQPEGEGLAAAIRDRLKRAAN